MSHKSKNQDRRKPEWIGDGALLFLARLVLVERYPTLTVSQLCRFTNGIVRNKNLTRFARKHNLPGADAVEEHICHTITLDGVLAAKEIISQIVNLAEDLPQIKKKESESRPWEMYFV